MLRVCMMVCLYLLTNLCFSQPSSQYQIDLIIFAHNQNTSPSMTAPMLAIDTQHAISLQSTGDGSLAPYHILPMSMSLLHTEYRALTRVPQYQVIAHYSWRQPNNSHYAVALPSQSKNGWNLEGTLRIRQSNYYLLDTELLFSTLGTQHTAFLFTQKQRLKAGITYYLDHPQAGMLIKVHPV